jgi:hypothetical protein
MTITTMAPTAGLVKHSRIFHTAWLPLTGLGLIGTAFMDDARQTPESIFSPSNVAGHGGIDVPGRLWK